MRIALIGPRGCGKTTIGRSLAHHLGCEFIDLDDLAAAQFGESTIEAIWASHGEQAWRAAELRSLRDVVQDERSKVIALGGGTPMIPEARSLLSDEKARGLRVVYLQCPVSTLTERLSQQPGDRPSLTGRSIVDEIADVVAKREPTFQSIADTVIDATAAPDVVAIALLRAHDHPR